MKKNNLTEEIVKMRKIMGLKENYDIDSYYEDSVMGDLPGETQEPEYDDELIEFDIPNWAISPLINGDESGLNDEEQERLDAFVQDVMSKYGNANFMLADENELDLGFLRSNDIDNLGGEASRLLIKPSSNMRESEGSLGSSIDERMMNPMNIALKIVEDLPEDYDDAMVNAAVEEYIKEAPVNKEVADRYMASDDWWASLYAKIDEVKTQGFNESDEPNTYTDKDQEEWDRDSGFDDGNDFMRISIPIMSALSDIQESNPELRNKINFIKALIQKSKIDDQYIDDSELNDLEKKFNIYSY